MRVLLAQPSGFCAGVEMAVATVDRALELFGEPLYAFHQIVHNQVVVADLTRRGVRFVNDIADIPRGAAVVFSAHGVSPDVRAHASELGLRVVDATCPLVTKVHVEARRYARAGYTIVLIGHAGHDETVGVMGEAPEHVCLVETLDDAERLLVPDPSRVAYLTQTTLGVVDTRLIVQALKRRFPGIVGPPRQDICYATENRQVAVRDLAVEADVVLVVGSGNSSNSRRLVEVAANQGVPALLVEGPDALRAEWLEGASTIVVTAGASVPDSLVKSTVAVLVTSYGADVEERRVADESVFFPLPLPVRRPQRPSHPAGLRGGAQVAQPRGAL